MESPATFPKKQQEFSLIPEALRHQAKSGTQIPVLTIRRSDLHTFPFPEKTKR